MNKTQLMRALQNYDLAERQAGPNASKDDIHKFYLNASLANHVGKYCSLEFFEFLNEKSKKCEELLRDQPKMRDFGLAPSHFRELSDLKERAGATPKIIGFLVLIGLLIALLLELYIILIIAFIGFLPGIFLFMWVSNVVERVILERSPHLQKSVAYAQAIRAYERSLISFWRNLSWREFEIEVARLFLRMGFNSHATKATGDSGVDVILSDEDERKIIVQCKHHARPVGPAIVREMIGTIALERADFGIIVGLSGFTQGAYDTAKDFVILLDVEDMINLTKRNLSPNQN